MVSGVTGVVVRLGELFPKVHASLVDGVFFGVPVLCLGPNECFLAFGLVSTCQQELNLGDPFLIFLTFQVALELPVSS